MKLESPRKAESITFVPDLISTGMIVDPVAITHCRVSNVGKAAYAEVLRDITEIALLLFTAIMYDLSELPAKAEEPG